jgi:hypothetical protein
LSAYRTPNDKLRREIGNILCINMKSAVKYTKRNNSNNNRCRSGDMIADGLGITGAECQVGDEKYLKISFMHLNNITFSGGRM